MVDATLDGPVEDRSGSLIGRPPASPALRLVGRTRFISAPDYCPSIGWGGGHRLYAALFHRPHASALGLPATRTEEAFPGFPGLSRQDRYTPLSCSRADRASRPLLPLHARFRPEPLPPPGNLPIGGEGETKRFFFRPSLSFYCSSCSPRITFSAFATRPATTAPPTATTTGRKGCGSSQCRGGKGRPRRGRGVKGGQVTLPAARLRS